MQKPHGNHKTKIYNRYTHKKENGIQNFWYSTKAVLKGKFITIQSHLKKQEKSQIKILTSPLK